MKSEKVRLEIIDLRNSDTQTAAYVLLLGETGGKRRIPVIIGIFEAQSIAMQLENMKPARPLTHDLFKNFSKAFGGQVRKTLTQCMPQTGLIINLKKWKGGGK